MRKRIVPHSRHPHAEGPPWLDLTMVTAEISAASATEVALMEENLRRTRSARVAGAGLEQDSRFLSAACKTKQTPRDIPRRLIVSGRGPSIATQLRIRDAFLEFSERRASLLDHFVPQRLSLPTPAAVAVFFEIPYI